MASSPTMFMRRSSFWMSTRTVWATERSDCTSGALAGIDGDVPSRIGSGTSDATSIDPCRATGGVPLGNGSTVRRDGGCLGAPAPPLFAISSSSTPLGARSFFSSSAPRREAMRMSSSIESASAPAPVGR